MSELFTQAKENLLFLVTCAVLIAALSIIAHLSERKLCKRCEVSAARKVSIIGICAAIATVLHLLDFPLPFLAPGFYKLDFSEVPVMLCGFYLGPSATVACEAVKILLKLLFKSTSTAFVGDFANFIVGCSMVIPAAIIYHIKRTKTTALVGLLTGTVIMTVFGSAFNAVYLLPKFSELYMLPLDSILKMGAEINPHITNLSSFVFFAVAPLNLLKGAVVSVLTLLLYKKVARPLFAHHR